MDLIGLLAGIVPLVVGAAYAARAIPDLPRDLRGLAGFVLAWAAVTVGVEILGTLGHLDRPGLIAWSVAVGVVGLGLGVGLALSRRRAGVGGAPAPTPVVSATAASPRARVDVAATVATVLVGWAAARFGIVALSQPVKVVSDGPIYHLYFAARWWQAGRIEPVASPFGEAGATYFWANGELIYAWLMTLGGGDRLARVGQVPFYLAIGAAAAALARSLGAGASAARLAAAWLLSLGPLLVFAFEPNVDAILTAGYLVAALFFVRAFACGSRVAAGPLVLGALAAGLGMGAKPTGIVFFPPIVALACLGAAAREAWAGRAGRGLVLGGLVVLASLGMMAYWPIRNALWTGNPLYPLQVTVLGRVLLPGWFGPEAMQQSLFYLPRGNLRALGDILTSVAGGRLALGWVVAALGGWAIAGRRVATGGVDPDHRGRASDWWVVGLTILGLLNLAAYWLVIPYRTQQRFCFPGFALLAIPLARWFDRALWVRWGAVSLLALHLLTPEGWPLGQTDAPAPRSLAERVAGAMAAVRDGPAGRMIPWDLTDQVPNAYPAFLALPTSWASLAEPEAARRFGATALVGLGTLVVVLVAGAGSARFQENRRSTRRRWFVALVVALGLGVGAAGCVHAFDRLLFPGFPDFYFGWGALDRLAGPSGARVAYSGHKIPYYLMGSRLQNHVEYVNIDDHPGWLMHDYHRHAPSVGQPTTWPNPFPGWDRLRPDYDAWLANLRAARIDFLVVTRTNPEEGRQNFDGEGYPIERTWADRHPAVFRPVFGPEVPGTRIRVYQLLPP